MMTQNIPDSVRIAVESLVKPYGLSIDSMQKKPGAEKRFVDVKGAKEYSSLSRTTLTRATKAGKLPQIKTHPGKTGKVLYDVRDLDKFLLNCKCRSL
jgi:hypothetical protein